MTQKYANAGKSVYRKAVFCVSVSPRAVLGLERPWVEQAVERKRGARTGPRRNAQPVDLETLNFKVPDSFKRAYKGYAAMQGMTMLELLKEGFQLSKQKRGRSR